MFGQTLELLAIRHNWGAEQVYYREVSGQLRSIPIAWTSLIPEDPALLFGQGRAPFRLADLLELTRLIDALREHSPIQMPPGDPASGGGNV